MLERILVTTDFSPAARRAVARAALLCKQTHAELTVLHVLPERALIDRLFHRHELEYEAMAVGAQRALRQELEEIERAYGVKAGSELLNGAAHRVIETAASALKADLLVIGARGESETVFGARVLGGTAFKCFLNTAVPLLLVRRAIEGHYYRVLAAVDGSSASRPVLAWALTMSARGTICEVLHAFEAPFEQRLRGQNIKEATIDAYAAHERERWERDMAALTADLQASDRVRPIVVRGGAVEAVTQKIREREPDLVVVGKRAHYPRAAEPASVSSVSLHVALDAQADVLVIP